MSVVKCFLSRISTFDILVKGNETYEVSIFGKGKEIRGSCTCPYDDICKHLVALLLFAVDNFHNLKNDGSSAEQGHNVNDYLQSLSINELIGVILKYAPEQFYTEVRNKFARSAEAFGIFRKVQKSIDGMFKDEELLYSPSEFEEALTAQSNQLKGLEFKLQKENFLLNLKMKINSIFLFGICLAERCLKRIIFQINPKILIYRHCREVYI